MIAWYQWVGCSAEHFNIIPPIAYSMVVTFMCGKSLCKCWQKNNNKNLLDLPRGSPGLGAHMTPAISKELQLWTPMPPCGQSISRDSNPVHSTLSSSMGPVPAPYAERGTACESTLRDKDSNQSASLYFSGLCVQLLVHQLQTSSNWSYSPVVEKLSWRQTIIASRLSHKSSHTVPHMPLR